MKNRHVLSIIDQYIGLLNSADLRNSATLLARVRLAVLFLLLKQNKKAEEILSEVSKNLSKIKDPEMLSRLFFEMGLFYREINKEEMKNCLQQAVSLSEKMDDESRASLLDEYSTRLAELGEQDAALEIALKIPIHKLRLIALYDLWSIGIKTPETEKARNAIIKDFLESDDLPLKYFAALQTAPEKISLNEILTASPEDSSQILVSMASKLLEERKKDEAISTLDKALTTIEKCDDALFKSQIILEIARLRMIADLESDEIITEAIEIAEQFPPLTRATVFLKAAEIYADSGKTRKANELLKKTMKLLSYETDPYSRFLIMEQIANHLIRREDHESLLKMLRRMLYTIKTIRDTDLREDAVLRLSELFTNLRKF